MLPVGDPVDPAVAPPLPERRPYEGRYVHLLPLDPPRDAPDLYGPSHGSRQVEALWTYLPYGPFADADDMRRWMDDIAPQDDPTFFTVRHADSGEALGMVSFLNIDPANRCVELGHIWYLPAAQRTRTNTESIYLMMEEAFGRLASRRVEWKCDSLNARSRAAALRLGFTFEGIFRQHRIVRDRNRDTAWFSLLDSEWPAVRDNLRRWLYDNDDLSLSLTRMNSGS
jgi:RimJ/RimL family protein N-acetyltransferase